MFHKILKQEMFIRFEQNKWTFNDLNRFRNLSKVLLICTMAVLNFLFKNPLPMYRHGEAEVPRANTVG